MDKQADWTIQYRDKFGVIQTVMTSKRGHAARVVKELIDQDHRPSLFHVPTGRMVDLTLADVVSARMIEEVMKMYLRTFNPVTVQDL